MWTWVCAPQATSSLKVCHRAERLSQGCTGVDCVGWPETPFLRQRQARIYCCVQYCPIAPVPIIEWSCGVLGNLSLRSTYIFQPLAVLSEGWPPLSYESSGSCGAKNRNIHVCFCSWRFISKGTQCVDWVRVSGFPVRQLMLEAAPPGSWSVSFQSGGKPGRCAEGAQEAWPTGTFCCLVVRNWLKWQLLVFPRGGWSWMYMFCTVLACYSLPWTWAFLNIF